MPVSGRDIVAVHVKLCAPMTSAERRKGGEGYSYPLIGPVMDGGVVDAVKAVLRREVVAGEGGPRADAVLRVVNNVSVVITPETLLSHCDQVVAVNGLQVCTHLNHPALHGNESSTRRSHHTQSVHAVEN